MTVRPRRSVLYMPGANERALEKAKSLPADALILDLEDSVAPEGKVAARDNVCAAVKGGGYGRRELVIRVNAIETAWGMDDLGGSERWPRRDPRAQSLDRRATSSPSPRCWAPSTRRTRCGCGR